MQELLQYLFSGITNGAIYAVIAVGFSMLYSSTQLINFAHGEFVMLGALTMVTLWSGLHLPLALAFMLTVGIVSGAGFVFERFAIRTVKKPDHIVLVIITVGASIFLRGLGMLIWGKDAYSVPGFSESSAPGYRGGHLAAPEHLDHVHCGCHGSWTLLFFQPYPHR